MIFNKPDGSIEFGMSMCFCCPPGERKTGQHLNSTSSWYRVNNGEWQKTLVRQTHYRTMAEAADSCSEFLTEIAKNCGTGESQLPPANG